MNTVVRDGGAAVRRSDPYAGSGRGAQERSASRTRGPDRRAADQGGRWLWYAVLLAALGSWLQECVGPWLMAELSEDVRLIASVQAVTTFAICVALVPAAAITDLVDRRRLFRGTHTALAGLSVMLGVLVLAGAMGPGLLLVFMAAMGLGQGVVVVGWPAFGGTALAHQAAPVAGVHAGRAAGGTGGAAVGGVLIGTVGVAAAFFANAAAFLAVSLSLRRIPAGRRGRRVTPSAVMGCVWEGLITVGVTPTVRNTMVRGAAFAFGAAALWALLVVFVREDLGLGPVAFGLLQAAVGLGGVAGVVVVREIRRPLPAGLLGSAFMLVWAVCLTLVASFPSPAVVALCLFGCGASWFGAIVLYELVALAAVPAQLRARSFGVTLAVVYLATAAGSAVWGHVAGALGLSATLSLATAVVAVGAGATLPARIGRIPRRP